MGDRARSLLFLAGAVRELLGAQGEPVPPWEARLQGLGGDGERFRIAVAGTVKSGKSTLVNALIGRDALKRGAGIVTSLVTRVRPGKELIARMRLKGWAEVNREATDAALFLGGGEDGRPVDLRSARDREALALALARLGEEVLGEGGFFDKNVALLRAYLGGQARVADLVTDQPRMVEFGPDGFERHREFAGHDALAAYVDDLVLEIPGLPFPDTCELADCQGYDSPNPRHMEMVQQYLLGAHVVVYVVSSRVGLREADFRFLRDIKALGLVESTRFVLNADLAEHGSAEDLAELGRRVGEELEHLVGQVPLHTFSALRALLRGLRERGEPLSRRDELLLQVWAESSASAEDEYPRFLRALQDAAGPQRERQLENARADLVRLATGALRSQVGSALVLAGKEAQDLAAERQALGAAKDRVQGSLAGFESALGGVSGSLKAEVFRKVDGCFHPSGGDLAVEVLTHVRGLQPPPAALEVTERTKLPRQMARIYHELRAAFQRYKVEVANPRAVDRIRRLWAEASGALGEAAQPPAELLVQSVEAYRREAESLGIAVPPLDLPPLDPSIGRTSIPLFSAVTYAPGQFATDRVLSFAGQWTRKLATGWAKRLLGKKERTSFARSLLSDGAEAVRELLAEEARSNLLHYNEQVKHQVLGKSLDSLAAAWAEGYRETVEALVVDLDRLLGLLDRSAALRTELVPRLQEILGALEGLESS
ncbi:MAG: dynamin family protein [Deferrisomatales bacterium]|nr:dynamin family protein [Deferrisomatales bacterium]